MSGVQLQRNLKLSNHQEANTQTKEITKRVVSVIFPDCLKARDKYCVTQFAEGLFVHREQQTKITNSTAFWRHMALHDTPQKNFVT